MEHERKKYKRKIHKIILPQIKASALNHTKTLFDNQLCSALSLTHP